MVSVVTIAASIGGSAAQVHGLVQRSAAAGRWCYIHQMHRVNSCSCSAKMTAP